MAGPQMNWPKQVQPPKQVNKSANSGNTGGVNVGKVAPQNMGYQNGNFATAKSALKRSEP